MVFFVPEFRYTEIHEQCFIKGFPFGTIGNEITEDDTLMQQDVNLIFELIHNKLTAFFITEKAKGLLSERANEDEMADFCIAAIQGAMVIGKVNRNARIVEAVAQQALAHLEREIVAPAPMSIPI